MEINPAIYETAAALIERDGWWAGDWDAVPSLSTFPVPGEPRSWGYCVWSAVGVALDADMRDKSDGRVSYAGYRARYAYRDFLTAAAGVEHAAELFALNDSHADRPEEGKAWALATLRQAAEKAREQVG